MIRRLVFIAAVVVVVAAGAAAPGRADEPPAWITAPDGSRFRVRFDPGERLFVGGGASVTYSALAAAIDVGLFLRSEAPAPGWEVFWRRQHELVRATVFSPAKNTGTTTINGLLYRGLFLRHSREGTLTLPTAPPVAFALPFDIGVLAEVGQFAGPLTLVPGGLPLDAGVVHGAIVADFLRSERHGRWLLVGVGGRYQVGASRDTAGAAAVDHRVTPMTALSIAFHNERRDGLAAGGFRAEASRRWSSARGWETAYRVDADAEVTPLALNDRPISLFATASAESAIDVSIPSYRFLVGVRFTEPLR